MSFIVCIIMFCFILLLSGYASLLVSPGYFNWAEELVLSIALTFKDICISL